MKFAASRIKEYVRGGHLARPKIDMPGVVDMKTPAKAELAAMERECVNFKAETNRCNWWQLFDLVDRQHVLCLSGIPVERASDALDSFSDAERARMKFSVESYVARVQLIARCFEARNTDIDGNP